MYFFIDNFFIEWLGLGVTLMQSLESIFFIAGTSLFWLHFYDALYYF